MIWQTKKLGEVLKLEYGKPLPKLDRKNKGLFPIYGANGIKAFSDQFYFDKPSIIVGRKGSAGELNLTEARFWPLDVTYFVTFDGEKYDLKFLYLLLLTLNLPKLAKGVKPGINRNDVYSIIVNIPSTMKEQKRIVKILDEVFEKIEKAKENTEKNLQNSRELFESFLQNTFAKSGKDWKENKLGEIAELIDSFHQTPAYDETGFPMVRVTDIKTGFLDLSKTRKVKKSIFEEFSKRHMPRTGDIVFSRVGSYGVSSLVNTNEPFCLGQNTVFIIPKINCNYLYYFINSRNSKEQIDKLVSGTTQPTISLKSIKDINVPIPSVFEQQAIVKKLDELSEQTKRLEEIYKQKLADLEELKKSVLQKAFAGEL